MTQEKMRKVITACVSAATVLIVLLLSYLIYQWATIANLNKRIEKAQEEVDYWTKRVEESTNELDYKLSEQGLTDAWIQLQMRLQEKNK
jgi:cell division protein FtsB